MSMFSKGKYSGDGMVVGFPSKSNLNTKFKYKKLHSNAKAPHKTDGNLCWDLSCIEIPSEPFQEMFNGVSGNYDRCYELSSKTRKVFHTGIAIELPPGYHAILKPRSGMAIKYGIDVLAGVIDNNYRGEILVCLQNHGHETVRICSGDRIAQMLIVREFPVSFELSEELSETDRGDKGFGSSGR